MTSLREVFADSFDIGVALGGLLPDDYSADELALINEQFSVVVSENCLKPESIQPQEGDFYF